MDDTTLAIATIGAISSVVVMALVNRWRRKRRFADLDLDVPADGAAEPSVLELLRERRSADGSVHPGALPPQRLQGDVAFAPGALDAILPGGDGDPRDVLLLVEAVNEGAITDWRVLEAHLAGERAAGVVDRVVTELPRSQVTEKACGLFWQLAREGRDVEAVKWGIVLGTLRPSEDHAETLELLALHPELTPFTILAQLHAAEADPARAHALVDLLPHARQWAVVRLVDALVAEGDLVRDPAVQRAMLIHAMENNDGIAMEVAFTVARSVDLPALLAEAERDPRLRAAACDLFTTLAVEPDPLGGLADLDDGPAALAAFRALLDRTPRDVRTLAALAASADFLEDSDVDWPEREQWLAEVQADSNGRDDVAIVREGLRDPAMRWMAYEVARARELRELVPDLETLLEEQPEAGVIGALAELGGDVQRLRLMRAIPRVVDVEERAKLPISARGLMGAEMARGFDYALIVRGLGPLGAEALPALEAASTDPEPSVRLAACAALAEVPPEAHVAARQLLEARLADPSEHVLNRAIEGLQALDGAGPLED